MVWKGSGAAGMVAQPTARAVRSPVAPSVFAATGLATEARHLAARVPSRLRGRTAEAQVPAAESRPLLAGRPVRTVVALPSSAGFVQQVALAFHERGQLARFETSFAYRPEGAAGRLVRSLPTPLRARIEPQLHRRALTVLPSDAARSWPFWEMVRTLAAQAGAPAPWVDRIWDHLSHAFTRHVARALTDDVEAVYAYEYTALELFQAAKARGLRTILDFPSLNSREFEELQRAEKQRYPELVGPDDAYFERLFERRQARRDAELALADIVITNSSVTRTSHVSRGAPPDRTFAVPLGAPEPVAAPRLRALDLPFRAVWAGTFSVRKGAHYLVEAWRKLPPGPALDIYGAVTVPSRVWEPAPPGLRFHGSVVRAQLFAAFDEADVLVFPTLADGFGMVVTEAFARGLPVITTDRAGASDLVRHGENGLVIPAGDPEALADALTWCIENRAALAGMRQEALTTARGWQWSDYRRSLFDAVTGKAAPKGPLLPRPNA